MRRKIEKNEKRIGYEMIKKGKKERHTKDQGKERGKREKRMRS